MGNQAYEDGVLETLELVYKILKLPKQKKIIKLDRASLKEHLYNMRKELNNRSIIWKKRYYNLKEEKCHSMK